MVDWKRDWNLSTFIVEYLLQVYTHTHSLTLLVGLTASTDRIYFVSGTEFFCLIYLRQSEWFFEIHCFGFWLLFYFKSVQIFTITPTVHNSGVQALWQAQGGVSGGDTSSQETATERSERTRKAEGDTLEGWAFFLPELCFCITKQWVSQIGHKQTLPFPRTDEVMQSMPVFSKWAIIGTSQSLNIHYL